MYIDLSCVKPRHTERGAFATSTAKFFQHFAKWIAAPWCGNAKRVWCGRGFSLTPQSKIRLIPPGITLAFARKVVQYLSITCPSALGVAQA